MNETTLMNRAMRLRVGSGVLARHEDLVLLCELPPDAETSVRNILDEVKAAASAEQPGRHMVRRLVTSLAAATDRFPSLCAFGAVGDGIAVAVHGKARLRVTTTDGELRLDGAEAVTILDRVVAGPVMSVSGEIGDRTPELCPWSELTSGVVRADALQFGAFREPGAEEEARPPAEPEETAVDEGPENRSQVIGVSCAKGHFNDPAVPYCAVCGIGLTQAGHHSAEDDRPSLGVLVLDDGTLLPMNKDYVIGRMPEGAADASDRDVMLLRLLDPQISAVHARIRLDGWEVSVSDADSANGTFVREPGSDWCVQVPSGGRAVLQPGAIVTIGRRQFRYDSYRRP
ncbi:FHA domain-containing protein [Amycolatopsis sp. NPDC021455]|uniref:FHA domain-containing protein n=1 Tax=Amycolatopsis sp. NPDC021455 TaxID=3154901 RepID=UPI0033D55858